jgi:hypothetical protein
MIQFKLAGASVQSITGSRGSNGSNAGYTMFQGSVKSTGYPLYSPVSPSLPHLCVTVCHHISTGLYFLLVIQGMGCLILSSKKFQMFFIQICAYKFYISHDWDC